MKVLARPIDMVCLFDSKGVHPERFRIEGKDGEMVVAIERVIKCEEEKLGGNPMLKFLCESTIKGKLRQYEIKFEKSTLKWMLFKI